MWTHRRLGGADEPAGAGALAALLTGPGPAPRRIDLGADSWLDWWPAPPWRDPDGLLAALLVELPLHGEDIVLFGRRVPVPRQIAYHGDPGTAYRYSGTLHRPRPWTPTLARVRAALRELTGVPFNAVLANHYRDGRDAMGYHADDEPELGPAPDDVAVASLSFGARRRFLLRARRDGGLRRFELGGGDLLVMRGRTQEQYRHALPRTRRAVGPRLNLTFRVVTPGAAARPV